MKKFSAILALLVSPAWASVVTTKHIASPVEGWQLLVDSVPYIVKGIGYETVAKGQGPNLCFSQVLASGATQYSTGYWDPFIQKVRMLLLGLI